MTKAPILAITMGDPAGVGPEIIVKALANDEVKRICRPVVIGDAGVMRQRAEELGMLPVRVVEQITDATLDSESIVVVDQKTIDPATFKFGEASAAGGHAAFEAVRLAIELALAGSVDATVTAPLHKAAMHMAGHLYPGHTEIFARLTGTNEYTMMLAHAKLRVVHVSTHVSLRQACDAVTRERVLSVIRIGSQAVQRLGVSSPRIGVAGLNPHAGDGGLFGEEELVHIIPAIQDARDEGLNVEGPVPPDTFYAKAAGGAYDLCVAMYHDQGHIPVKLLGFGYDAASNKWTRVNGINVTLGLPIIRTSVDHGTAFDQVGKGTVSELSMIEAIEYAAQMALVRK